MNLALKIIKEFYLLIIIYFLTIFTFFLFINHDKSEKIDYFLKETNEDFNRQFKSVYENINIISQNSFYGILNKPEIVNLVKESYLKDEKTKDIYRKKLYDKIKVDYERLKSFNFLKLHFHHPDNTSFLRMYKPNAYGDDLSSIRSSVVKVNKTFRPVKGFEIGKYFEGFRFVYPMFDDNLTHVGSVEISLDSKYFERNIENFLNLDVHFLLNKKIASQKMFDKIFENFESSNESDDYIYSEFGENIHFIKKDFFKKDEKDFISKKMQAANNFDFYKEYKKEYYVLNFIPIADVNGVQNSAYMIFSFKSDYIKNILSDYYKRIGILLFLIVIFIIFVYSRFKLVQKYKYNETLLTEQSKMASIGEMIENISHQWRQPLSVISVAASGLKLKHEHKILNDEDLDTDLENIIEYTQYLSNTIEDFRNYFSEKLEKKNFNTEYLISNCVSVFRNDFDKYGTKTIINTVDIDLFDYEAQLKHVLVLMLKNINDFRKKNTIIYINCYSNKDLLVIEIQDNCGGIPDKIMKKIFEPYFTTKHQSMGSGLGLYISYEIIVKTFGGNIFVENRYFDYQLSKEYGAFFRITIPLNKKQ